MIRVTLYKSMVVVCVLVSGLLAGSNVYAGQCIVAPEVGVWKNMDSNTRGVTKVEIKHECVSIPSPPCNGNICTITSGVRSEYKIKVWGSCSPTDCFWGQEPATYTSSDWMRGFYDHGFATRWVWGQVWSGSDNYLRFIVDTDFVSSSRTDYRSDDWFVRQ